jgi:Coenzyme PQQ synthesis protein D (PqqD)
MNIQDNSNVVAIRDLLCCDLADGAVILDLKSGVYYGLDAVGTFIWGLIQEPKVVSAITAAMLEEYSVERERCAQDLKRLLAEMVQLNLIEVRNGYNA